MKQNIWEGLIIRNLSKQLVTMVTMLTAAIAVFQASSSSAYGSDVFSLKYDATFALETQAFNNATLASAVAPACPNFDPNDNYAFPTCVRAVGSTSVAVGAVGQFYFETYAETTIFLPNETWLMRALEPSQVKVSTVAGGSFSDLVYVNISRNAAGYGISQPLFFKGVSVGADLILIGRMPTLSEGSSLSINITSTPPPPTPTPTPAPTPLPITTNVGPSKVNSSSQPRYHSVGTTEEYRVTVHNGQPGFQGNIRVSTGAEAQQPRWIGVAKLQSDAPSNVIWVPIQLDSNGYGQTGDFWVKGIEANVSSFNVRATYNDGTRTDDGQYSVTPVNVERVWFERDAGQIPLDTNPQVGGGLRVFPEKKTPTDTTFGRSKVIVKAKIFPAVQGVKVNFKIFDVDDPTTVDQVIDPTGNADLDPNGTLGNDNRGASAIYPIGTTNITNASGEAFTYVQISPQPGDNIRVAATTVTHPSGYNSFSDLVQIAGTQLTDISGNILGADGNALSSGVVTPLLTTWRRPHIERDSMGAVTGNFETRTVLGTAPLTRGTRIDLTGGASLNYNRFAGGRVGLSLSGGSSPAGYYKINGNGANWVSIAESITTNGHGYTVIATLYDDDDVNGNDGANQDGDNGEDVPMPSIDWMADNDNPGFNGFFQAYIRPTYDLTGSENSLPFTANIPKADNTSDVPTDAETGSVEKFDNAASREDQEFWTVYLFGAYQSAVDVDLDPDQDYLGNGFPKGYVGFANDLIGAVCFMEHMIEDADHNYPIDPNDPRYDVFILPQDTPFHEVSHMLGSTHGDGGRIDKLTTKWSGKTLDHMRSVTFPQVR